MYFGKGDEVVQNKNHSDVKMMSFNDLYLWDMWLQVKVSCIFIFCVYAFLLCLIDSIPYLNQ